MSVKNDLEIVADDDIRRIVFAEMEQDFFILCI